MTGKMDRKPPGRFNYKSKKGSGSKSDSGSHSLEWLRAMALRQWRHGDPVKDPVRNIHHAGDFLDKLLSINRIVLVANKFFRSNISSLRTATEVFK